MSIPKNISISCPKCEKKFNTVVFQSLNTNYDKDVVRSVISGERFNAKCPRCGFIAHLEYDVLYHDLDHGAFIWVVNPNQTNYSQRVNEVRSTPCPNSLLTRLVPDTNALREKAACLAAGRDDKIIELCKVFVESQVVQQRPDFQINSSFYTISGDREVIFIYDKNGTELCCDLNDGIYNTVQSFFDKKLQKLNIIPYQVIDHAWATEIMNAPLSEVDPDSEPIVDAIDDTDKDVVNMNQTPTEIPPVRFCRRCGARLLSDSIFCSYCGTKVVQ